jgi:hypothetical protein
MSTQHPASLDGTGAGDHDQAYTFGRRPSLDAPFPFSTREYARLLVLRSRFEAPGLTTADLPTPRAGPDPAHIPGARAVMPHE